MAWSTLQGLLLSFEGSTASRLLYLQEPYLLWPQDWMKIQECFTILCRNSLKMSELLITISDQLGYLVKCLHKMFLLNTFFFSYVQNMFFFFKHFFVVKILNESNNLRIYSSPASKGKARQGGGLCPRKMSRKSFWPSNSKKSFKTFQRNLDLQYFSSSSSIGISVTVWLPILFLNIWPFRTT